MNQNQLSSRPLALITGASAGIGAEFARQLAAMQYNLLLTARRSERLESLATELAATMKVNCHTICCDLGADGAINDLVAYAKANDLRVDLLVNNAGYALPGDFTHPAWEDHARFLRVMVESVVELTYAFLPDMQKQGRGAIINVASLAGLVPGSAGHTLYGASKSFLIRFSESLALENIERGIRVQALCPGFTYSEFHDVTGTRDMVSQMPSYMWMEANKVVAYSLRSLRKQRGPVVVVPGRINRLIAFLVRKLPSQWAHAMVARKSQHFRRRK